VSASTHYTAAGSSRMPSLDHATVADAMHPGIVSCDPDLPLTEVARTMASHHVHCLAVMGVSHAEPECLVWGIITDLDLVAAGLEPGGEATARSLARHPMVSVESNTPLREACRLMIDEHISHLVVRDSTRMMPVGILSTLDVTGILAWGEG
jgi:CBS domain-containing protein